MAAVRRSLEAILRRSENGQSLIEVVIALAIFAVVAGSMITLLTSSLNTTNFSRQKTAAQEAIASQIEQIRNMDYDDVGTSGGNPPGLLSASQNIAIGGCSGCGGTETIQVGYVNEPTPLSYQSYANYKRVTITITRKSDGRLLAQEVTNVAPPVKASQNQGQVIATVDDVGNNTVLPGVTVNIANGPSGSENDTTDASGTVTFAALTPTTTGQPYYTVTATPPAGYVLLSDTTPPNSSVQASLSPTQTWSPVVKLYKPATIYVDMNNADGSNLSTSATVSISSSRQTQSFSYTAAQNGLLTITALNGEQLVSGLNYTVTVTGAGFGGSTATSSSLVPIGYPATLTQTFTFTKAAAPVNTALPAITGTATSGQTLTATTGTWTGTAPITYTYQWQDCNPGCVNIGGATASTYVLSSSDVGGTVQVIVTANNLGGSATATSAPTAVVGGPPVNTVLPSITGTTTIGSTLTANKGTWTGTATITYTYQWQRCSGTCSPIAGATAATYVLAAADAGTTINVVVKGTNGVGNSTATSAATGTAGSAPVNTVVPTVSGAFTRPGTVTSTSGTWTGAPTPTYTYQWQVCTSTLTSSCSNIGGATGTSFSIPSGSSYRSKFLRVNVTGTNVLGNATASSAIMAIS